MKYNDLQEVLRSPDYRDFTEVVLKTSKQVSFDYETEFKETVEKPSISLLVSHQFLPFINLAKNEDFTELQLTCVMIPIYNYIFEGVYLQAINLLTHFLIVSGEEWQVPESHKNQGRKKRIRTLDEIKKQPATSKMSFCNKFFKKKKLTKKKRQKLFNFEWSNIRNKLSHVEFEFDKEGRIIYNSGTKSFSALEFYNEIKRLSYTGLIIDFCIKFSFDVKPVETFFEFAHKLYKEDPDFQKEVDKAVRLLEE
ncbi:MAG: hypothetical protein ACE5OZ_11865 [Candidatus Heimdallarchaeota archaeon]